MGLAATGETLACFRRPLRIIYSFGLAPLTGYWILDTGYCVQTKPNRMHRNRPVGLSSPPGCLGLPPPA